jgi:hypothetical protein
VNDKGKANGDEIKFADSRCGIGYTSSGYPALDRIVAPALSVTSGRPFEFGCLRKLRFLQTQREIPSRGFKGSLPVSGLGHKQQPGAKPFRN